MFVKNNTTGKCYIDCVEVTPDEYESRKAEFWASHVPSETDPDPELTDSEALAIILGGGSV
jgi:hypothetical protein